MTLMLTKQVGPNLELCISHKFPHGGEAELPNDPHSLVW